MIEKYHPARDAAIEKWERDYLERMFKEAGGEVTKAAKLAGIDRATIYRLVERHEIKIAQLKPKKFG